MVSKSFIKGWMVKIRAQRLTTGKKKLLELDSLKSSCLGTEIVSRSIITSLMVRLCNEILTTGKKEVYGIGFCSLVVFAAYDRFHVLYKGLKSVGSGSDANGFLDPTCPLLC